MLQKRWKINDTDDEFAVQYLAESLNISEVLASLLVQRGIKNFSLAKYFFRH